MTQLAQIRGFSLDTLAAMQRMPELRKDVEAERAELMARLARGIAPSLHALKPHRSRRLAWSPFSVSVVAVHIRYGNDQALGITATGELYLDTVGGDGDCFDRPVHRWTVAKARDYTYFTPAAVLRWLVEQAEFIDQHATLEAAKLEQELATMRMISEAF